MQGRAADEVCDQPAFALMPAASTTAISVQVSGFEDIGLLTHHVALYAISVRPVSALPAASFRSFLAEGTLAVRLTVPPIGPVGDFHSQVGAALPGAPKKEPPFSRWLHLLASLARVLTYALGIRTTHVVDLIKHGPVDRACTHYRITPLIEAGVAGV
jgi:hypothetical protein